MKSGDGTIDRSTVDSLAGALARFGADEGLFVSWSGFKSSVKRDLERNFFRMRLWTQDDLLDQLLSHYERLDGNLKAELPLRRIWAVALSEED